MKKLLILLGVFSLSGAFTQNFLKTLSAQELFGSMEARHIGPALMSGRVSDIEGHPSDKLTVYIGTAGGGVWKSTDGGVLFTPIFDKYCQSIGTVKVDPNDPDRVVWVGTGETWTRNSTSIGDGIYKSEDGGANWKKMGLEKSERISNILINPENSQEIFVGVLGALWGDSEERGVYHSSNGGQTWEKIFYIDEKTGCSDLIVDPNDFNTMYASFWEFRRTAWSFNSGGSNSALYKTADGGKTWKKIHNGFPEGKLGRIGVALAPLDPKVIYAVVESEKDEDKGLYRSEDAGNSWKHLNNDFDLTVRPFYFSRIVVDPKDANVIAKAGLSGAISKDGGKTFVGLGFMHSDIHDIWFDIEDSDKMLVATDGGLYRSLNKCVTMERVENLPLSQYYHISMDNEEPYNIYGGLQDNGSWIGPSSSPAGIEARDWLSVGMGDGFRVFPHPTNSNIVYSEMQGAENVWRFDQKSRQLKIVKPYPESIDQKLRFNWNAALSTSIHYPDRLYLGSQFVHVSDDMGENWRIISPDLTTNDPNKLNQENSGGLSKDNSGAENHCTIFTIAESPLNKDVIWVGTDDGNIQLSKDGGKNWENVTAAFSGKLAPKNTWVYHIEADKFNEGTAWAVLDGHTQNDSHPYLIKTTDFGKSWKLMVDSTVIGFTRSFEQDNVNEKLIFLGTELGLYVSINGGENWIKFENNMPSVAIHYMEMHPKKHDLVMGTHGRGIILLDDLSPIRKLLTEDTKTDGFKEELTFIPTPVYFMSDESSFGNTSTETQFVGSNPSDNAKIIYFLKKRHTFGKMNLEIRDLNDKLITTIGAEKKKGLNIVEWNYSMISPKIAQGKTLDFGGFISPRVEAGKYKVIITKGKKEYTTEIEIAYPENSVFSLEDRKIQYATTMEIYNLTEDLAYLVHQIDFYLKLAENYKENNKYKKEVLPMVERLNGLKKTLVITSGDNYVGAAEPQLREKISDLMSSVSGYFGKPGKNQLENLKGLKKAYEEAESTYKSILNKEIAKFTGFRLKDNPEAKLEQLQSKTDFLKK
ncbi:MAG: hypothetical protein R2799_02285 [Crocinitomicaceae bacterium]